MSKAVEISNQVRTTRQAQIVIADLLERFASNTAQERIVGDARFAKQSVEETTFRTAGNLLNSFVVRKPGGFVY